MQEPNRTGGIDQLVNAAANLHHQAHGPDELPDDLLAGGPIEAPDGLPAGALMAHGRAAEEQQVWRDEIWNLEHPMEHKHAMDLILITKAAHLAAQVHAQQRRKGKAAEPYFNHLADVSSVLARHGADAALIAAGYLHDAIEDQGVPPDLIRREFGDDVLKLVVEVTDDKSLPKARRKALQIEHAASMSRRGQMLKIADKLSNLTALLESPPSDWSTQRRREYADWALLVVNGCRTGHPQMAVEFDELRAQLLHELHREEQGQLAPAALTNCAHMFLRAAILLDQMASQPMAPELEAQVKATSEMLLATKHDLLNALGDSEEIPTVAAEHGQGSVEHLISWAAEAIDTWADLFRYKPWMVLSRKPDAHELITLYRQSIRRLQEAMADQKAAEDLISRTGSERPAESAVHAGQENSRAQASSLQELMDSSHASAQTKTELAPPPVTTDSQADPMLPAMDALEAWLKKQFGEH